LVSNFRFGFSELGFLGFLGFRRIDLKDNPSKSILPNPMNPKNPNSKILLTISLFELGMKEFQGIKDVKTLF
jgi:hypothetical protein